MNIDFIEWLESKLGDIYVWGAQGQKTITEQWIYRRETSKKNAERAIAFWKKRLGEGATELEAYDCSGLIVHYLNERGLMKNDENSRGLYNRSEKLERDELRPCDLVFRHNGIRIHHVGVYVGEGYVIEAKGRDDGVVKRNIDASGKKYWNRYGRLALLSPKAEAEKTVEAVKYKYVGATYVNLRTQPDSSTRDNIVGRVSRGDIVLVKSTQDRWAQIVDEDGTTLGYCVTNWLEELK